MKYAGLHQDEDGDSMTLQTLKTRGSEKTSFCWVSTVNSSLRVSSQSVLR
jgi:hypothetical protein